MTWDELLAEELPDLSPDERGYVLWNHTGFPGLWSFEPEDEGSPERCCRRQLREWVAAVSAAPAGREGDGDA